MQILYILDFTVALVSALYSVHMVLYCTNPNVQYIKYIVLYL